jgi:ABC-type Na+ transport system ATPase subunit NatA|tara:strand:+ start:364 stop:582 length:219 start_codon:yes stop_codon:yes gene_type:complete
MTKKITPKKFSLLIEQLVLTKRLTHFEAVMYYCEQNNLEAHTITKWIDKGMREKIQSNAEDLNYLPKSSSLF